MRLTFKVGRIVVFDLAILDEVEDEPSESETPEPDDGSGRDFVERRLGSDSTLANGEVEPPAYPMDRNKLGFR